MIYLQLFLAFLRVGFFAFGGGAAALPLIEKEVVENYHWLQNGEFLELVTLSELSPGPIGINSATYAGFKVAGFWGAFVATVAFCFPSFLLVFLAYRFLSVFEHDSRVQSFLRGLRPAVLALMGMACYSIAYRGIKDWFTVSVAAFAFFLIYYLRRDPILVLLLCGLAGILTGLTGLKLGI